MNARSVFSLALVVALGVSAALSSLGPDAHAADRPFPAGPSKYEMEGLDVTIFMPDEWDAEQERSMILILHGNGGSGWNMAHSLAFLAPDDYVIVSPKSTDVGWAPDDLERVKRIVADLKGRLNVGEKRLHAIGYSNGGWNLATVAFDEELYFTSACWVAAGYNGGKVPKHAKKGMGVLALVGAEDGNLDPALQTAVRLREDVRSTDCRVQPGLGHNWPRELMPYYGWWVGAQEGRFSPGSALAFDWDDTTEDPPPAADDGKSGSFVYWYSADDAENEEAKALENETFLDASVLFFGRQLRAVRRNRADHEEAFAEAKLKETPAIVVYDRKGKAKKTLSGKIKARSLASAFRAVAAERKMPD